MTLCFEICMHQEINAIKLINISTTSHAYSNS